MLEIVTNRFNKGNKGEAYFVGKSADLAPLVKLLIYTTGIASFEKQGLALAK